MTQETNKENVHSESVNTKRNKYENEKRRAKKKEQVSELMTRVVIRQLPPTMTEQDFLDTISPMPQNTEFYYVNGDTKLGEFAFSRAYIKFVNFEDLLIFKDKYDDYVFIDSKGNEYPAIVEYALLQKLPRRFGNMKFKQDSKTNTIENDVDFIAFQEELKNSNSASPLPSSSDILLDEIENKDTKESENQMTPLVEFLNKKWEEKIKIKEHKKRMKDEIKKKKIEESKLNKEKKMKEKEKKAKEQNKDHKNKNAKPQEKKGKKTLHENETTYFIKVKTDGDGKKEIPNIKEKNENDDKKVEVKEKKHKDDDKNVKPKQSQNKEAPRIRNKDRPTREIYRPGMARQKQNKSDAPKDPKPAAGSSGKAKNEDTDEKPTTSVPTTTQQYKFKHRVFTRTKN